MTIKDIIANLSWEDFKPRFEELYPDQIKNMEGYEFVYNTLKQLSPKQSKITIKIDCIPENDGLYYEVYGVAEKSNVNLGIEFTPWAEWLGMEIMVNDIAPKDVVIHCLYEMTFLGFSQEDIKVKASQIFLIIRKVDND